MRYYKSFLVLVSILAFTLMTGIEAKAQCPTGYSFQALTLTVQDCDYLVQICYQCNPTNNSMSVKVTLFGLVDPSCIQDPPLTPEAILGDIYAQLNDPDYIEDLCGLDIPPCVGPGSGTLDLSEERPTCWRKYNNSGNYIYEVCPDTEDVYCLTIFKWCYDANIPEYRYTRTTPTQYGDTDECQSEYEPDPVPGQHSYCFRIITICD